MMQTCDRCGAQLLQALGQETIRTLEGEALVFRRNTDYVVCAECFAVYSIEELRSIERLEDPQAVEAAALFSDIKEEEEERVPLEDLFE